ESGTHLQHLAPRHLRATDHISWFDRHPSPPFDLTASSFTVQYARCSRTPPDRLASRSIGRAYIKPLGRCGCGSRQALRRLDSSASATSRSSRRAASVPPNQECERSFGGSWAWRAIPSAIRVRDLLAR